MEPETEARGRDHCENLSSKAVTHGDQMKINFGKITALN